MVYRGGADPILYAGYPLVMLFVLIHEFGHCVAAQRLGSTARRITLTGVGGIAEIGEVKGYRNQALVTAAGPATNLAAILLSGSTLLLLALFGSEFSLETVNATSLLLLIAMLNVILLLFNLIPVYPMDGGRLLRALTCATIGETRGLKALIILTPAIILIAFGGMLWLQNFVGSFLVLGLGAYGMTMLRDEHRYARILEELEMTERLLMQIDKFAAEP